MDNTKKNTYFNLIKLAIVLLVVLFTFSCSSKEEESKKAAQSEKKLSKKKVAVFEYDFNLDDFEVIRDTVRKGDFFGSIMDRNGIGPGKVFQITQKVPDSVLDFRRVNIDRPYVLLRSKDSLATPLFFIYEKSPIHYASISLGDSVYGNKGEKPVTIKKQTASGVITSSLSDAIDQAGIHYLMTNKFADIYQWSIDFFRIQKGDQFKIVYTEKFINDTIFAGIDQIEAAVFKHKGRDFYAFNYLIDSVNNRFDYFDEEANTLRSFFLQAPLQYSRISSYYSPKRFHPVQKTWKAHKGTDYAAPTGTLIWSTADGVVTHSGYTAGNGNYVKVKHTTKYATQYLHMSKRAAKVGQYVKQGEVIGYVGSTGLATGPHVCYRFWVDGEQVDPRKQDLPDAEPMEEKMKPIYLEFISPIKQELDLVNFVELDI